MNHKSKQAIVKHGRGRLARLRRGDALLTFSVRCSVRDLVTSSTLFAVKTLHWRPLTSSTWPVRNPQIPDRFLR